MIHPPLHYFLSAQWVNLFGIGPWQFLFSSKLATILMFGGGTLVSYRFYGFKTAFVFLALATITSGTLWSSQSLRPDATFGLMYQLTLIFFAIKLIKPLNTKLDFLNAFALSLFCTASLATHYFGFFILLYLPVYLMFCFSDGLLRVTLVGLGMLFGITAVLIPWALLYGGIDQVLYSLIYALLQGGNFVNWLDNNWLNSLFVYRKAEGGSAVVLGLLFFLCRLAHVYGILYQDGFGPKENPARAGGAIGSWALMGLAALACIF